MQGSLKVKKKQTTKAYIQGREYTMPVSPFSLLFWFSIHRTFYFHNDKNKFTKKN